MKSIFKSFFLSLSFLFLSISTVNAQPNQKITPTPSPKAVLPEMISGQKVTINTPVNRDLFTAGSQVSLEATVSGDVYVAGGEVDIKNTINENLIVAGGKVNISGTVNKNLIVAGGQINLEPSAVINGYVLGASNLANISGKINGPVKFAGNTINVSNNSVINGDLEIYSRQSNIDPSSQISGEKRISHVDLPEQSQQPKIRNAVQNLFSAASFFYFLAQLLVLFLIIRIFGKNLSSAISNVIKKPLPVLGQGLVGLIIIPFVVILLMVTIIGIPLGVITGIGYGLSLYFASIIGAIFIGQWFFERKWVINQNLYIQAFIGYIVLFAIGFIPVVGPIFKFIAFLLGLGLIFQWEKSWFNQPKAKAIQ